MLLLIIKVYLLFLMAAFFMIIFCSDYISLLRVISRVKDCDNLEDIVDIKTNIENFSISDNRYKILEALINKASSYSFIYPICTIVAGIIIWPIAYLYNLIRKFI